MRNVLALSLASLAVIASACASTQEPTGGAEAGVQLEVPEVLAWEPGGPFDLKLSIVNNTRMILMAVEPKVEASDVILYGTDGSVACRTPQAVNKVYEKYTPKGFQPSQRWEVKRDMHQFCPNLPPGLYRYEANYRMNNAEALRSLYTGHLGPQGGKVLVKEGASSMKYEDLVAAVESPEAAEVVLAEPPPAEPAADGTPGEPAPSAAEIRACVDKELTDRGLNAYGDPKGTSYAGGNAPVDEFGRILYVASRNPGIRRACKVPNF